MKYYASLCALVLAGSMPGFAVSANHTSVNPENQFHFKPSKRRAAQVAARDAAAKQVRDLRTAHVPSKVTGTTRVPFRSASAKKVQRHTSNPATGKIGFLSATQIPAGGESQWLAVTGDFNHDGKTDVASEVYTSSNTYAISVVLSNGDGTFQAPVLNPITDSCAAVLTGDINGDGKTDLIVAHAPNQCGNSNTVPTFEVWISNGDGTFTPSSNVNNSIPTTGAAGGTLADVNGDGKLDIVIVDDSNPANVWTFLGIGDGTFQPYNPPVALSGEVGYNVVVADLSGHGNGLLDIADNDYNTNSLTVYLATSTTTYGPAATYQTPDNNYNACTLTAGDLNGDGKPELINTNDCNSVGNDITVYVNNGDGTFGGSTGTGTYYNSAMSGGTNSGWNYIDTSAVTVADVNGDGKADIVATNYESGDVTILFGNGDGTVNEPTKGFAVGGYPSYPALVADFNGDGFADIIVPDYEFSFAYLRGYGDGTFRSALNYYAGSNGYGVSYGIATGDFNKDGRPDVVIANYCNSCTTPIGITVFLSNPDGSLQAGMNFENGTESYYFVAVADFNGDGNLDVVATDYYTGTATPFYGDGTGNFTVGTPFNTDLANNGPYGVFVGDFNKDGHPDLAVANWTTSDISILLNDGSGNFPLPVPITLSGGVWQGGAVGDLGNGNPDLVLPYYYGSAVAVLVGDGMGNFTETDVPLGAGGANAVTIGDFGNGEPDLAVTLSQGGGQDIAILLGKGDGTFPTAPTLLASSLQDYNLNTPYPEYIQAVDVDGDGKLDLVYANEDYGTVGVLFGKGDGTFPYDPVEYPVNAASWSLAVADVNGDGAPDVVSSSVGSAVANVLLNNNGTGTLGSYTIGTSAQGATLTAGQTATFTLTITPNNHYNGTVTLSCPANLPALMTCSLSSSSVTLDGLNPQTVTLTITTKAASSSLRTRASVDQQGTPRPRNWAMLLASLNGMGVFGMVLAGGLSKKRNRWNVLAVLALAMSFFLVGCGGSSNNNNNNPPPTKSNTTSAVASSAATTLVGQAVTFTGTVSASSGTPTGTVTFLDGKTSLGTGTLSSGKATFQTSSLAAGVHSITIAYGGDSSYNTSTSTAYSQTVDNPGTAAGNYTVTVTGTGTAGTNGVGSPNQSVGVTVVVQ